MREVYIPSQENPRKTKMQLQEQDKFFLNRIQRHDARDTSDLPTVLKGLSQTGEFTDIPVHSAIAVDKNGIKTPIIEPTEAIMIGSATPQKSYEYLKYFFKAKILPPEFNGEPTEQKDFIRKIWHEHKAECDVIIEEAESRIRDLKSQFEDEAYRLDDGSLGENAQSFKRGEGSQYENYMHACEPIYDEAVQKMKEFASKIAEMMT